MDLNKHAEAVIAAIDEADCGHSIRLTRLVDDESTYSATVGDEVAEFEDMDGAAEWVRAVKAKRKAAAILAALTALADEAAGEMRQKCADRCEEQQCRICGDLDSDCRCRSPLPDDHLIEATGWACARAIRAIPLPSERK